MYILLDHWCRPRWSKFRQARSTGRTPYYKMGELCVVPLGDTCTFERKKIILLLLNLWKLKISIWKQYWHYIWWWWYDMKSEDCNLQRNQTFGGKINLLFVYFLTLKIGQFDSYSRLQERLSTLNTVKLKLLQLLWVTIAFESGWYSHRCANILLPKWLYILGQKWRHVIVSYFWADFTIVWFYHGVW